MFEVVTFEVSLIIPSLKLIIFWLTCGLISWGLLSILFFFYIKEEKALVEKGLLVYEDSNNNNQSFKSFLRFGLICIAILLFGMLSLLGAFFVMISFLIDKAKGGREKRLKEARERMLKDI